MKKIIFIALIALGLSMNAQVKFNIGVKAGANYSSLIGKTSATDIVGSLIGGDFTAVQDKLNSSIGGIGDNKISLNKFLDGSAFGSLDSIGGLSGRTSFHAGLAMELKFLNKFAIQSELLFSAQGGKKVETKKEGDEEITSIFRQNFNYLNFPILFKYYPIGGLNIQFGPQLGILLSSSTKLEVGGEKVDLKKVEGKDIKADFKKFFDGVDFGLAFGLGYTLKNGINLDARYILGVTGVQDSKEIETVNGEASTEVKDRANSLSTRNGVFQISLGYFFL